jgi:hypothetical protein
MGLAIFHAAGGLLMELKTAVGIGLKERGLRAS